VPLKLDGLIPAIEMRFETTFRDAGTWVESVHAAALGASSIVTTEARSRAATETTARPTAWR